MPGVPSGRGCEACRKQKKKCDAAKSACSRCARLKIACIGAGQQRYKFKDQTLALRAASSSSSQEALVVRPSRSPSNEVTVLTSAWISALGVTDIRYDLSVYGGFLKDIPRRIGTNDALDASANAMATAFSSFHIRHESVQTLTAYGKALKALREALSDPTRARSPDTLCAMYFLMICQGWIGRRNDPCTKHTEAMAAILNDMATQSLDLEFFRSEIFLVLCVSVIMDSFYNTKVKLGPWLWKIDATYGPQRPKEPGDPFDGGPIESLRIQSLAKIPDFLHHPEVYFFEIQATYQLMLVEVPKLRGWLAKTLEQIQTLSLGAKAITFHTRLQSSYALLITMALLLNGILRAFDPLDISLINEAMHIPSELLEISKDASKFRPLGASYMPLCLMTAWAATPNILDRPAIEEMIEDYSTDFAIASWMVAAVWLENQLNGIRLRPATSFLEQRFEGPIDASWKLASALDGDPRAFEHTGGECSVS